MKTMMAILFLLSITCYGNDHLWEPWDGDFELVSYDWFEDWDTPNNWFSYPYPDYQAPVAPWPDYPYDWFQDPPSVPVIPFYCHSPSRQVFTIDVFHAREWFTEADILTGAGEMEWVDSCIYPTEGQRMALLTTGPVLMPDQEYAWPNDFYIAQMGQYVYLRGDERLHISYRFCTSDYGVFNDYANIIIVPFDCSEPNRTLVNISVTDVGDKGDSDWLELDINLGVEGAYYIVIEVHDIVDPFYPSVFLIDNMYLCRESFAGDYNGDCIVNMKDFAIVACDYVDACCVSPVVCDWMKGRR